MYKYPQQEVFHVIKLDDGCDFISKVEMGHMFSFQVATTNNPNRAIKYDSTDPETLRRIRIQYPNAKYVKVTVNYTYEDV